MRKDERGTILIEFVGSFLLFFLLIMSILSLINICVLQARVHYALTETADTISMYGYLLHVTGADGHLMQISDTGSQVRTAYNQVSGDVNQASDDINKIFNGLGDLSLNSVEQISGDVGSVTDDVKAVASAASDDPIGALKTLARAGLNEGLNAAFGALLKPLVGHYLSNGGGESSVQTADDYLKSFGVSDGVDGLTFYTLSLPGYIPPQGGDPLGHLNTISDDDSTLLNGNGDVRITVQYQVDYAFGGLQLPFAPKLTITQSVMTKMWLGGEGDGYSEN